LKKTLVVFLWLIAKKMFELLEKAAIQPMAAFSNNSNFFLAISHENTTKVFFKSADVNRTNTLIANSL